MPPDTSPPAYFLALLRVPDIETYRCEYGRKVFPQLEAAGARVLVASANPTVLEGEWGATWTALIQFPNQEAALRWYQSEDYAPLKKLRLEELTTGGSAVIFETFQPVPG